MFHPLTFKFFSVYVVIAVEIHSSCFGIIVTLFLNLFFFSFVSSLIFVIFGYPKYLLLLFNVV